MFRRSCLGEIPKWVFNLKMGDWLLHILHAQNGSVANIDEVMAVYRVHNTGLWSQQTAIENALEEVRMFQALAATCLPSIKIKSKLAWRDATTRWPGTIKTRVI